MIECRHHHHACPCREEKLRDQINALREAIINLMDAHGISLTMAYSDAVDLLIATEELK